MQLYNQLMDYYNFNEIIFQNPINCCVGKSCKNFEMN